MFDTCTNEARHCEVRVTWNRYLLYIVENKSKSNMVADHVVIEEESKYVGELFNADAETYPNFDLTW